MTLNQLSRITNFMEEMIEKWIRETILESERARRNQNLYKMNQMKILKNALIAMRDKLLKKYD